MSDSEKFLIAIFSKLTGADFKHDEFLSNFYKSYKSELTTALNTSPLQNTTQKTTQTTPLANSLLQHFIIYICKNKVIDEKNKTAEYNKIYDDIKQAMLNDLDQQTEVTKPTAEIIKTTTTNKPTTNKPTATNQTTNKPTATDKLTANKPTANNQPNKPTTINKPTTTNQTANNQPNKYKLSKLHTLNTLSDFIKQSFIITSDDSEESDSYKESSTTLIYDELIAAGCKFPIPVRDVRYNRRNDILEIWQDTEKLCDTFMSKPEYNSVLTKVHIFDAKQIKPNITEIVTLEEEDFNKDVAIDEIYLENKKRQLLETQQIADHVNLTASTILHGIKIKPNYKAKISTMPATALLIAMQKTALNLHTSNKTIMICCGSRLIPGGGSDQGFETNETPLYCASTYSLCVNKIAYAYATKNTHVAYMPKILVFKDHMQPKYPLLRQDRSMQIAVLVSYTCYRPKTTLVSQDSYNHDTRLYEPTTRWANPDDLLEQLRAAFNAARFLGYNTVVIDDCGIDDFWLPLYHTAILLNQVIHEFKSTFVEIIVAVKKELFPVVSQLIK